MELLQRLMAGVPLPVALVRRFGLYCMVGAAAFASDYSVFLAALHSNGNPYAANILGICAGIVVSFSINRIVTFRKTDATARRAAKFVTVALMGMAISSLSIMLLLSHDVDVRLAKVVAMVFVFGLQFLANSLWTFR